MADEQLELDDIQGAIIPGFKKDYALIVGLLIEDEAACKTWLREIARSVATASEVLRFNRLFKEFATRRNTEAGAPKAVWLSLSFSEPGLSRLRPRAEIGKAFEGAFVHGMYQSALCDPSPETWEFGASAEAIPHILLVIAADDPGDLQAEMARIVASVPMGADGVTPAVRPLASPQAGATLPGALRGHEHFGFKDGISQPAIRGLASADPQDFIDARRLAPSDPNYQRFAEPGRLLVWPGQFVIGYNRQNRLDALKPAKPFKPKLAWQRNGSYLVYRRLQQRTYLFWDFCRTGAETLSADIELTISPTEFASRLVGRWPSGAPVLRTPDAESDESAAIARDDDTNNNFAFSEVAPTVTLADGTVASSAFPPPLADPEGRTCPFPGHIRKVNPRDDSTDTSGEKQTPVRLMLRRGIPYGPVTTAASPFEDDRVDRGLLFMSYQASIGEQFEFVTKTWVNLPNSPHDSRPQTGQDPLIGQSDDRRFFRFPRDDKAENDLLFDLPEDPWVRMTGGGYFFTPSISALSGALAE